MFISFENYFVTNHIINNIINFSELAVRQINDQMLLFERSFIANEDLVDDDKTR